MDFYQAQDRARKKTWQLTALFIAAVTTLVIMTNILVATALYWTRSALAVDGGFSAFLLSISWENWALISLGVIGVVGVACVYKHLTLRAGGRAVAESLGGRQVMPNTADPKQKRLLNIVEEMAIASGVPVPPVYLIDEPSINAFAAGFGTDDAVVGVNQGTIDHLNRSELQGVIAHEFSHILNADTGINLKLITILHGILFIGMIGYGILRIGSYSGRSSRGNGGVPLLVLGMGLVVIGYGGTFFGRLIKAAVNRQREFLADSSAVQFTRSPEGIGGALKKIGGLSAGSFMSGENAGEASHMFFGEVVQSSFASFMASHPRLDKRILAIDPRWDGRFPVLQSDPMLQAARASAASEVSSGFADASGGEYLETIDRGVDAKDVSAAVGQTSSQAEAQSTIATVPSTLNEAAHEPFGACALVYALLISDSAYIADEQMLIVQNQAPRGMAIRVATLSTEIHKASHRERLVLLEMALPALKTQSQAQYRQMIRLLLALIKIDQEIDLFEWVLHRVLVKELRPHFERVRPTPVTHRKLESVARELATTLSIVAQSGASTTEEQLLAFKAGANEAGIKLEFEIQQDRNFQLLNKALHELQRLNPLHKPKVIKAATATIMSDHVLNSDELALVTGIAATLDCPLPPVVRDQYDQ